MSTPWTFAFPGIYFELLPIAKPCGIHASPAKNGNCRCASGAAASGRRSVNGACAEAAQAGLAVRHFSWMGLTGPPYSAAWPGLAAADARPGRAIICRENSLATVLIVDDHPFICFSVRTLVEREGHQVVAEASNGIEALRLARQHRPDLAIVDVDLPRMDGLQLISRMQVDGARRVLVLTAMHPRHFGMRCMDAGAAGFVYKQKDLQELVSAVRAVMAGNTYYPESVFGGRGANQHDGDEGARIQRLSDRELLVLRQLAQGALNKTIATDLMLSPKTISTYKTRLLQKLNAESLVELADIARRNGLA
jgi:two-component system response regulator EvgA